MSCRLKILLVLSMVLSIVAVAVEAPKAEATVNSTQTLNTSWISDANNGFTQPIASDALDSNSNAVWIDNGDTSEQWIEFSADPNEGLFSFDLTSLTLGKFRSDYDMTFEIVGTRTDNTTTNKVTLSWPDDGTTSKMFSGADLSGLTGLTKFKVTLGDGTFPVWYAEFRELTIANQVNSGNASPVVANLDDVTFQENTVNGTPQQIDADVEMTDDSADFNGGQVTVSYTDSGLSEDHLAVGDIGSISVSGDTVYYDSDPIGTVSSDGTNGSNLVVDLNAKATPARVTELLRALTYGNTSNEPASYRTISITVSDGHGGTSAAATAKISVSGQAEAGVESPALTQDLNFPNWVDNLNNGFTIAPNGIVTLNGDSSLIWLSNDGGDAGPFSLTISAAEQFEGGMFDLTGIAFDLYNTGSNFTVTVIGHKAGGETVTTSVNGGTTAAFNAINLAGMTRLISFDVQIERTSGTNGVDYVGLDSFTIANPQGVNLAPVFNSAAGFGVSETALVDNTVLHDVQADDGDGGANDTSLIYSIVGGTGQTFFTINSSTGKITLTAAGEASLDFESAASYTLTVRADDGQSANNTSEQTITVNVDNIAPAITAGQSFTVSETATGGTLVGIVATTGDDDSVNLSIESGNRGSAFTINAATGEITVNNAAAIDHETTTSYTLSIKASDGTNSSIQDVTVNVSDEAPAITTGQSFTVSETAADGTAVGTVDTSGDDSSIVFSIKNGNSGSTFAINADTGEITVNNAAAIDYEITAGYTLTIQVTDGTNGPSQDVTVNVSDVAPALTAGQSFAVSETAIAGTLVGTVATSGDETSVAFSIFTGNEDGIFVINSSTGKITVGDSVYLDYETTGNYTLTIRASDGNTDSEQDVIVNVANVNEAPTVSAPVSYTVTEDVVSQITGISIADEDAGAGEALASFAVDTGTLSASSGGGVTIGGAATALTLTGKVTDINNFISGGNLSYITALNDTGNVNLRISVNDRGNTGSGGAKESGATNVTINVIPVNDAPSFTKGPDQVIAVNAGAQTVPNWATNISAGPAGETGQSVAFSVYSNDNAGLFAVQPAVAPDGTLTYTPAAGATGSATIALVLKDKGETANGGADTSVAKSFVIHVTSANGGGTLTVSAGSATAGQTGITLNFTYLADAGGINNGAIAITVPDGWSVPGTGPVDPGYITAGQGSVSVSGRTITISGITLAGGDSLTIKYGDKAMGGPGATVATTPGTATWEAESRSTQGGILTGLGTSPAITVIADVTDTNSSTVVADPATVPGDGSGIATITVTLKDRYDNLISGQTVELTQGSGSSVITPATAVSDNNGQAVFTVHSVRAETVTYTARDISAGVTVAQTAKITFTGGVDVMPTGLNLTEGDNAAYTVVLDSQPVDTVTVSVYGGSRITVTPASLSFNGTNWNIARTVKVTVVDDHVRQGDRNTTITNAVYSSDPYYNNIPADPVNVHIIDNDSPAVSIVHPGGAISVMEGGTQDKYAVELTTQPSDSVIVSVYGNNQVTLNPAVLTFAPHDWDLPQEVMVTAVDDNMDEGLHIASVTHSVYSSDPDYKGIVVQPLTVHITDNDAPVVSATINPDVGSFDKNPAGRADACTTIIWNNAAQVTDIKADGTSIGAGSYSVNGNTLTIKKEYLATRPTGDLVLTVEFDKGNVALLTINISDTTPPTVSNPPVWPAGSTLTAGGTTTSSTILSWTTATDDVGVTGYRIYQYNSIIQTVGGGVYSYEVTGLSASTTYTFQVQAGDADKNWTSGPTLTVRTDSSGSSGNDNGSTTPQPVNSTTGSANVNPVAGGTVSLGNEASVTIPSNALSGTSDVQVNIQELSSSSTESSGFKVLGSIYELSVDDHEHYDFSRPVTLTFTFDPAALAPGEEPAVIYYDEEAGQWVNIGGTVSGNTITVTVDHFTKYAVMIVKKSVPATEQKPVVMLKDISGHWAETNINELVEMGAISGYPDGTFRPDNTITRAEFAAVLVKAFHLEAKNGKVFKDTTGHWAKDCIATAAACGIVNGYDADYFGPDDPVTREQVAKMTVKAARLHPVSGELTFTDREKITAWAKKSVVTAVEGGIMSGYFDNTFRPKRNATRAEAVTVIVKALK